MMPLRYLIAVLMYGLSVSGNAANAPHDAALEKLQAKIVARFYQTTYGAKARCPAETSLLKSRLQMLRSLRRRSSGPITNN